MGFAKLLFGKTAGLREVASSKSRDRRGDELLLVDLSGSCSG
jgi:hypothetical protein